MVWLAILIGIVPLGASSQMQWSQPIRIFSGDGDQINPSFVNRDFFFNDNQEILVFTQLIAYDRNICLLKTTSLGALWIDTVFQITHSGADDFATLASAWFGYDTSLHSDDVRRMVLWQHGGEFSNVQFSYDSGRGFLYTVPLTSDSMNNQHPGVSPRDSGFGAVWERAGRIAFSEFLHNQWSPPVFSDVDLDTG